MMETGYFEQHKLRLLATQPGVCRTGRYFHPPLVTIAYFQIWKVSLDEFSL